ncbi:MAG TPA: DUF3617 family protein [Smithellaceae bacterium]|nr:DUF3617 family protein [Smithellaceae bacterium]
MRITTMSVMIAAGILFFATGVGAQIKDGLWEFTTQVQMQGIPQPMPPATFRQCITKEDPVVKDQDKNHSCKTTRLKISGNTVSYAIDCQTPEGTMSSEGKNTYTGSTMAGEATTRFKMKGQPAMQMKSRMKGKYIGPCPK